MQQNNKKILCHKCNNAITSRRDLITAFYFFILRPYHASCYSQRLKTFQTFFVNNYPVNGFSGILAAYFTPIAGILWIFALTRIMKGFIFIPFVFLNFFIPFLLFGIFASLLPPFIRLYSYYVYEKPLAEAGEKIPRTLQLLWSIPLVTLILVGTILFFLLLKKDKKMSFNDAYMECRLQDTQDIRLTGDAVLIPVKQENIENIQIETNLDTTILSATGYKEFSGEATIKVLKYILGKHYVINGIINTSVGETMTGDGIIEIEYDKDSEKKRAIILCNTNISPGVWE